MYKNAIYVLSAVLLLVLTGSASAWTGVTVGDDTPLGSESYDAAMGTWTIEGDGHDIWDNSDDFRYVYKYLIGDGSISARVVEWGNGSNAWAKAGVMMREDLTGESRHAMTVVTAGNGGGGAWQRRMSTGGGSSSNHDFGLGMEPGWYVKVERTGDEFKGYVSQDGVAWDNVGDTLTLDLRYKGVSGCYIGLCVTSHAAGELRMATLDNVVLEGDISDQPPIFYKAYAPIPPDGDVTVMTPLLQWASGETALFHDVYVGTSPELTEADLVGSRQPFNLYFHVPGLEPGMTYYWRVDEIEADMTTIHTGDLWTFTAQPFTAYVPSPPDGGGEASPDPNLTLTWLPGRETLEHHVYFSANFDDVNDGAAAADRGTVAEPSLMLTEALGPLATYYWRVDETGFDGTVRTGDVWSFTTFSKVDDFESYGDDMDADNAIFQTWVDGIDNGTGSYVGYEIANNGTFGETTIVNSGGQSMPLDYNNVISPYYSETSRTWAAPQNFTAGGANTLVLYVRGNSGNAAESLYVGLEDTGMRVHVEVHPDASVAIARKWMRWAIPLSVFSDAGVNVAAIKTMYMGLGDRSAPILGGAGLMFIDDIRLIIAEQGE